MSASNYPGNFKGKEGEEVKSYLHYLQGEIENTGEGLTEEESYEEVLDMTIREALSRGLFMETN